MVKLTDRPDMTIDVCSGRKNNKSRSQLTWIIVGQGLVGWLFLG